MSEKQSQQAALANKLKQDSNQSFARRDALLKIEKDIQAKWEHNKQYETDAPKDTNKPKFLVTFPFPYMNGKLHLGHAFSMSKAEFQARYQRYQGKEALFPFGFHCTGMPIVASADKLKREIQDYGFPPQFPERPKPKEGEPEPPAFQWDILKKMGFEDPEEIRKFQDPLYWLSYFPPRAVDDLKSFGVCCDFRRSFITTDVNPYFDSFVRWQFNHLKQQDKIKFGKRYGIFAPRENQMCADHDRLSGEGVKPKEYTIVKMKVVAPFVDALKDLENNGKNIYFAAATLRPETMYGQTNCWLLPEGQYGAFQINETDIFILTERAARNLAYQGYSPEVGKVVQLKTFTGQELFGTALSSPLAIHKTIYCLPMMTVSTKKTTGVVTSVPSDSPDDYAAYMDLKNKPKLREKYGIKDEWILPFDLVEIINVPEYGDRVAPTLCEQFKIRSQNDAEQLEKAKDEAYTKGFNYGTMLQGEFKGRPVKEAKPIIREQLIQLNQAIPYAEPENVVVSRSGETCVVALLDQWFLNYGEESWQKQVSECLSNLRTYNRATRKELDDTVDWLHEWGCSRSYGLGTRLPWDSSVAIESLSDSTIYMAYYTVAHLLQGGVIDGSVVGPANIKPEQMTQQVWDHIIYGKPLEKGDNVPTEEQLAPLRREFLYWYGVDLRVSGKDLIKNHLTFFMYNHVSMFPKEQWPGSIYCNGWVMVNGEKMSKSKGNFLTVQDIVSDYSADAARIALADAGDTHDDANFVALTANSSVLKLTTYLKWVEETLETADQIMRKTDDTQADRVFESRINLIIEETTNAYENMLYKNVVLAGWYSLQDALKTYITATAEAGIGLSQKVIQHFLDVQTILMAPITPHISDHIWTVLLKKGTNVFDAPWPQPGAIDKVLLAQQDYLENTLHTFRSQLGKDKKRMKNKAPTKAYIYVADKYTDWQLKTLEVMREMLDENIDMKDTKVVAERMGKVFGKDKKQIGTAMGFASWKQEQVAKAGKAALDPTPPFDERELLTQNMKMVTTAIGVENVEIYSSLDENAPDPAKRRAQTLPGKSEIAYIAE